MWTHAALIARSRLANTAVCKAVVSNQPRRFLQTSCRVASSLEQKTADSSSEKAASAAVQNESEPDMSEMTPRQVVQELDKYVVGQAEAKKAIAVAFRNRWRRQFLNDSMKNEIYPKNLLMIGSTGVGKTEIARRLAKLSDSPFIKVEATRFTEVGYVGSDVDDIIDDLLEHAIQKSKTRIKKTRAKEIEQLVNEKILQHLLPKRCSSTLKEKTRQMLVDGQLEDEKISIEFSEKKGSKPEDKTGNSSLEDIIVKIDIGMFSQSRPTRQLQEVTVKEARVEFEKQEIQRMSTEKEVVQEAIRDVEQNGIVFIDEIDKICTSSNFFSEGSPTKDGVQRDLLPLVEGSSVKTDHGSVNTSHILFIASGAFHVAKPSDMLPELQGRFPVRVEMHPLVENDYYRILTEPVANLVRQQVELMKTEGIDLQFTTDGIKEISHTTMQMNSKMQNIGARRLHSVMELVVEDISFRSGDFKGQTITIDKAFVKTRLKDALVQVDLSKFVL